MAAELSRRLAHVWLVCLLMGAAGTVQAQGRVALVIGNGAYQGGIPALANPPRDARAVARLLERLGFQVNLLLDADRPAMLASVQRLGEAARGAEAALLFYAGHAAEAGGQNLLFPVSVSATRGGMNLARDALNYSEVTSALDGKARTTLILLDSCRDNPLAGAAVPVRNRKSGGDAAATDAPTRSVGAGLASVASASGTLIAYATAPGQVALDGAGQHSPFTEALLRHMETPDIEVRDMLTRVRRTVREATGGQQVPWDNSSLDAPFFLRTAATATASAGPTRRIVQEAAAQGIPLPRGVTEERFQRPASGGGLAAQLVGSWSSGDRRWGGQSGRRNVLIVLSVNESQGTADTIFAQSAFSNGREAPADPDADPEPGYYKRRVMSVARGSAALEWMAPDGRQMLFVLSAPDIITATFRRNLASPSRREQGVARVQMRRID